MQARLDRFLSKHLSLQRKAIKPLLASGRVQVDGVVVSDADRIVTQFNHIVVDDAVLQQHVARYLMLNKPAGVVSATKDAKHKTVIDLIEEDQTADLHIAGRLDFNSTGLLLLTNDGRWSRQLSLPENNIRKRYRVTLEKPLTEDYVQAFSAGMYFEFENITTRPVELTILTEHSAEVVLCEGRYHQIKRMFGRFNNEVLTLHRTAIGDLSLDNALSLGESRPLRGGEVRLLANQGINNVF
jgi:16S rRNA pseudouridine516 synthase